MNNIDEAIETLRKFSVNLYKSTLEFLGEDLGPTNNKIEYRNYLIDNPIQFGNPGGFSFVNGNFEGAGGGKEEVPQGFYSDQVLYNFISNAEGTIGVQWVSGYKSGSVVPSAACYGYDFPGGVHDPSFISKLGLTQSDANSLGISQNGRKPIGGESYGGKVQWGWYTQPVPADHPYWKKLIPYYRDAMIWAWRQPGIQAIKNPGERLARMHTINWYGYHYMKGLTKNDVGWNHRLQVAKSVTSGMGSFA